MINVMNKIETLRIATAQSCIKAHPETIRRMQAGEVPKPDVLGVAKTAAVMAAKKTPELLPYCHPLPLDGVEVNLKVEAEQVVVTVAVSAIWKTGVEMEALTAASVAALTIYDMLKPIDSELEIVQTKLLSKSGGKGDFDQKIPDGFRAAVLVTSDGTHQGKREDKSGKLLESRLREMGIASVAYEILPDEATQIRHRLLAHCENGIDLILTTGGTGLGPRDVTVEATAEVLEREMPAVMQAIRGFGQRRTPYAMLSRGLAGLRGRTVILNLPGSSRGAAESMDAVFPALLHVYPMLAGGGH
ncbi:MAG TPA: bifunctional molybdenum cofactor biosynthesis protein MoaC/MoaB [bacterium]|nr:bifunctional molybdenum cofactor biosynthesis protein MoaC/MoaB [bacterium]